MSRDALEEPTGELATARPTPDEDAITSDRLAMPLEHAPTVVRPLGKPPAIGDVIADKYRLVKSLGRGGMGRIFSADHLLLGIKVALKFMHPHLARDRAQVSRFSREARAAATLKSPNAARIIDVDQLPGGELYIVMEYLEGRSLETLAVDGRGLPVADAVHYVMQACDALAEAHARSIIHRDVKPANLFLTRGKSGEPVIKVLDFGLAKALASSDGFSLASSPTAVGQAVGTPYYMAPEQITGASPIDGRSDVWAIGTTLYELLTGRLAFDGATAPQVFDRILKSRPMPIRMLRPDVPMAVDAIIDRCLQQDMNARFQSVRDLVRALEMSLVAEIPFVAAPLTTERFVRSSAPPLPSAPQGEPSVRGTMVSLADAEAALGPSMRQTVLAALAGPALVAVGACVVAVVMWLGEAETPDLAAPHEVVHLTAKSGDVKRAKVVPRPPEKAERSKK